ncbi:hypothetical protein ABZ845_11665 [Streptomyces sp. NPDC047022]|uniref:hypothetical protein n=1 Tax=Streptomyces sp. NPDC047022 TaxID=3155737 RepID=UPI0033DC6FE0
MGRASNRPAAVVVAAAALAPTFRTVESPRPEEGEYTRHVRWLEPRIREYRELLHSKSMRTVQKSMRAARLPAITAIVITRELLGSADHGLEDARIVVFDDPAWQRLADIYRRDRSWLDGELERLS